MRARERAGQRAGGPRHSSDWRPADGPIFAPKELIEGLVELAPARLLRGDHEFVREAIARLCDFPEREVRRAVAADLRRVTVALWDGGWQPAEVIRHVRRTGSASAVALARWAIAADLAARATATLDPRWSAQLDALELPTVAEPGSLRWVASWAGESTIGRSDELATVFELLATVRSLPRIEVLIPPPGHTPAAGPARSAAGSARATADRAVLDKVRALLVKAEATTFEAEAEAFTAKAHEMMARHAIDAAMLAPTGTDRSDGPITIRVGIDDPYADAKSLLLQVVAQAGRCRTVFHDGLSLSSVIGFAADVAAAEMLYTSLLVQAQAALAAAGRSAPAGSRPRSRSFRSAFLVAYTQRIGQRLDEISAGVVVEAEAEHGQSLLPVLRSRQDHVDAAVAERFPGIGTSRVRGGDDLAGWASGRMAADHAQLSFAELGRTA